MAAAGVPLWTLQEGRRGRFALLVPLTLLASPLAFVLLLVVVAGVAVARRPSRRQLSLPAAAVLLTGLLEVVLVRLFPDGGRFPFQPFLLVPAVAFCVLGVLATRRVVSARPLTAFFGARFL